MAKFCEVDFGSTRIKFYPLTIGQMQDLEEEMKAITGMKKGDDPFRKDRFEKLVRVFTESAKRGDPTVTEAQVKAVVDMENLAEVTRAVLGQTGMVKVAAEGSESTPTSPQIGGDSTQG